MSRRLLGVDGGNSKTIAAVACNGEVVGLARGAGSDIHGRESPEAAVEEIRTVVEAALADAGVGVEALSAAAFSLAGADWPEDFTLLEAELTARLALQSRPTIVNDALGALRSGAPTFEGVAVAAGTYNAVGARNRDGRMWHIGFWPDPVGGFDLGLRALKAVYREGFGVGPATALTPEVLETFQAKDALDLMHAFTRREGRRPIQEVQRLAPVLLDVAEAGDPVAREIVADGGRILGEQGRAAATHVGLPIEGVRLVLTGGVMQHPSELLARSILAQMPGAVPCRPTAPPVVGALLLAADAAELALEAEALSASLAARTQAQAAP